MVEDHHNKLFRVGIATLYNCDHFNEFCKLQWAADHQPCNRLQLRG